MRTASLVLLLSLVACATPQEKAQERIDQALAIEGAPSEAIALLNEALALDPTRTDALPKLAALQFDVGAYEAARTHAQAALEAGEAPALDLMLLDGRASAALGDHTRAAAQLQAAATLDPDQPELWLEVAAAHEAGGDTDDAIEAYEQVSTQDTTSERAHRALLTLRLPVFEAKVAAALEIPEAVPEGDATGDAADDPELPEVPADLLLELARDRGAVNLSLVVLEASEASSVAAERERFDAATTRLDERVRLVMRRRMELAGVERNSLMMQMLVGGGSLQDLLGDLGSAASDVELSQALGGNALNAPSGLLGGGGTADGLGGLVAARGGSIRTPGVGALGVREALGNGGYGGMGLDPMGRGGPGSAPRMRLSPPVVTGALVEAAVRRVVRRLSPRLRLCYERLLNRDPSLEGDVSVVIRIDGTGHVTGATGRASASSLSEAATCAAAATRTLRFPAPSDGASATVIQSIAYAPPAG